MAIDFSKMITAQDKARQKQERINAEARRYLAETDWYVTRFAETSQPIPEDIAALRQAARDRIVE